ncbi:MAG: hypothetical protein QOH57_5212 [Mycobacterium sp.]|jgi:uncharacterized protein (DUF427 family)|nr:hypothetical protein [Mycobacterium sp.]
MLRELFESNLNELRYEPTAKHLRAAVDGNVVADTHDGLLVWEPRRLVPAYAIPVRHISAALEPAGHIEHDTSLVLDPSIPFSAHTTPGEPFDVVIGDVTLASAAFRPTDSALADHVILDFGSFDWREEDEPIVSHPRDPYSRIDTLRSSRHVQIELDGQRLADSVAPVLLFETRLPVRYYLPAADVTVELEPSETVSYCAYKGRAAYLSIPGGRKDIAWTYPEPLHDAAKVRDYVCFFNERVDVVVDGRREERPRSPWSD